MTLFSLQMADAYLECSKAPSNVAGFTVRRGVGILHIFPPANQVPQRSLLHSSRYLLLLTHLGIDHQAEVLH